MEPEAEVLVPLELHYSDLVLLSSSQDASSSLSTEELEKIESISAAVMRELGPSGPGLLTITGVPKAPELRRALLPLARKLALLGSKERAQVLKDNGLGSDVPLKNLDRSVSSFAMQLKYEKFFNLDSRSALSYNGKEDGQDMQNRKTITELQRFHGHEQHFIGHIFKELGLCMIELGLRLALICDNTIGGTELGKIILEAGTAKGRLIHYHSVLDKLLLKEEIKRTKGSKSRPIASSLSNLPKNFHDCSSLDNKGVGCTGRYFSNLWQQWHHDYGIFTVLTSPLFLSSCGVNDTSFVEDCLSPVEHTYLQLFDSNTGRVFLVKTSPENFIIQVGESADILSNGKLRSTLHSVLRPSEIEALSRETFVVFLQPPWDKVLPFPSYLMDAEVKDDVIVNVNDSSLDTHTVESRDSRNLIQQISKIISPLSSRLRCEMTFAEFSRETTKKYYGGSGTQSGRQ